jgi:uncharacterized protein YfdQ (DUF2303 family)
MTHDDDEVKNIAETLIRNLPKAEILATDETAEDVDGLTIHHIAVPKGFELKTVTTDNEKYLPNPRRTKAKAVFSDLASFLAYLQRHNIPGRSAVWADFNPRNYALSFRAVFDEHAPITPNDGAWGPGWREHHATYKPLMSSEWDTWVGGNKQVRSQIDFAEFLQANEEDISAANGLPSSIQMLEMATNFVMNEERALKSAVRLASGGVRLTYLADPDQGTLDTMQLFERFAIAIPVFQGVREAYSIVARLKYRTKEGKVTFSYELHRPDRVHAHAAQELIDKVRAEAGMPLYLGDLPT